MSEHLHNFNEKIVAVFCPQQSCVSARAFRFGPQVDKNFGLNSGLRRSFVFGAQKYNRNNLATLLDFSDLT